MVSAQYALVWFKDHFDEKDVLLCSPTPSVSIFLHTLLQIMNKTLVNWNDLCDVRLKLVHEQIANKVLFLQQNARIGYLSKTLRPKNM